MPWSCWMTAMSKQFSAAAADRCESADRVLSCPTTSGKLDVTAESTTRTTPALVPLPGRVSWRINAEVKLASPHCVGEKVLRKPYELGTGAASGSASGFT